MVFGSAARSAGVIACEGWGRSPNAGSNARTPSTSLAFTIHLGGRSLHMSRQAFHSGLRSQKATVRGESLLKGRLSTRESGELLRNPHADDRTDDVARHVGERRETAVAVQLRPL